MFESGAFVAAHVDPVTDDQVQPNGVDLRVAAVSRPATPGRIGRDATEIGDRRTVEAEPRTDGPATYELPPGGYVVEYAETVRIPEGHVGFVYPRSSLLRNGCTLDTAVWDAGYEGKGEGLLEVHAEVEIETDARVAQLVLATADHEDTYDGSYQGERLGGE